MTWWLEAGENGSDRLDLMSGASGAAGYSVMSQGFDIVPDAEDPDRFQILSIPLLIKGSSKNDLFNKRRAILTKLSQASFNRQPGSGQPRVTIAIRFGDADTLVRWVIESGNLTRGNLSAITTNHLGSMDEPAILQLRCWRGGIGERIDYGPFTVSGADPTLHINGVPGDLPGVLEVHVEDTSTNSVAVNRLIWACRSLPDMDDGDFNPVLPFGGAQSSTDTFTGNFSRLSANTTWQTIGSVSRAASVHDGGVFDVYARLRDPSIFVESPLSMDAGVIEGLAVEQSAITSTASTSVSLNWSKKPREGNTLLMFVRRITDVEITVPTGWTSVTSATFGSGSEISLKTFYKTATADEDTQVSISMPSSSATFSMALVEVRGTVTAGQINQTSTNTHSTSSPSTGSTPATTQAYTIAIAAFASHTTGDVSTTPTNYTTVLRESGFMVFSRVLSAAGTQLANMSAGTSREWSNALIVLTAREATAVTLPANTYDVTAVAVNAAGTLSAPSPTARVILPYVGGIMVDWTSSPQAVSYRVYRRALNGAWVYTTTSDTSLVIAATGGTSGDPPASTAGQLAQFRAFIGRENSATQQPAIGPFTASVANSEWEWVYLRRVHLPPSSTPGVADMTDWTLVLQGRADTSVQLDADAILLLPADENSTVDACYPPKNLSTPHEWHVWATPQGVPGGYLTDGTDEAGNLRVRGVPSIGPGDTTMTFVPSVAGGISNVEDVEFDVSVYVWPRYEWLAGEV